VFDEQLVSHQLGQVPDDRTVFRHPACKDDRLRRRLPAEQRVVHVGREAAAEAVADGRETVAFLLGVDQICLGENGAARGYARDFALGLEGRGRQLGAVLEPQALGLLIEEAAGTGCAQAVEAAVAVFALLVEDTETEALTADQHQGTQVGVQVFCRPDRGHQVIDPARGPQPGGTGCGHRQARWCAGAQFVQHY